MKQNRAYKHIFFDLDHTLWDFESSSIQTLKDMYSKLLKNLKGVPGCDEFIEVYHQHNERLWALYREGKLEKEVLSSLRFADTLRSFDIGDDLLASEMGVYYVYYSPRNVFLFPFAIEILDYLKPKYHLHLITNGFEEVQSTKLEVSGLGKYFQTITTSEEAGVKKPDAKIFEYALAKADAIASESIMIGDDLEVDLAGAKAIGMDQVYFNPNNMPHNQQVEFEVNALKALMDYF
ncbi:MAG: YjjG family noncanonical pyrimidine nucleotidase [Ignavibacteria bacterium]|nr:YjjG family noncanonical pyrimidine nucleotidase [Ignavibacteria bacterium]